MSEEGTEIEVGETHSEDEGVETLSEAEREIEVLPGESAYDPEDESQRLGLVDREQLKRIVEGALFAADKPMSIQHLTQLFFADEAPNVAEFKSVLEELGNDYEGRGVELKEVSSGFRFQVVTEVGPWVSRLWDEKPARYSRALLETLALVAYRQPITRGEIEEIRGVSVSSHIMKTLLERDWVRVVGHRDVPGRPAMYATTRSFLDYFNLKNLDELPSLAEIRDLDKINEELELIESNEESEEEAAPEEETVSNSTDTEADNDSGHNKPKLTLHDIARRMEGVRDTTAPESDAEDESSSDSASDEQAALSDSEPVSPSMAGNSILESADSADTAAEGNEDSPPQEEQQEEIQEAETAESDADAKLHLTEEEAIVAPSDTEGDSTNESEVDKDSELPEGVPS